MLPVHRTRAFLPELHRRLREVLQAQALAYELIFVDDACPEGSLADLRRLTRLDPRVTVVALARNVGQQGAVLAGLRAARGARVVIMDADLQDPPEAIPWLLSGLQEGHAIVFAGRRGRYEPPARLLTSRVYKLLLRALCGLPADAGLFLAMTREAVERVLAFPRPGPHLVAMVGCTGLPMTSIPVERAPRPGGGSAYRFRDRLRVGIGAVAWVLARKLAP